MASGWREAARSGPKIHEGPDGFYLESKPGHRVRMTNFTARIVEQVQLDAGDGRSGEIHRYVVAVKLGRSEQRLVLGRAEFEKMGWISTRLGARAIVYNTKGASASKVRQAIQEHSKRIKKTVALNHIGWHAVAGRWLYLHAGGAEGANGRVTSLTVEPPEGVHGFRLPAELEDMRSSVGEALAVQQVAPDVISLPLMAATWRAPLGEADFSVHICGKSGNRKTQLAALMQQHFGAGFAGDALPASFVDTPNALGEKAFLAKDAVLVVDDFVPASKGAAGVAMQQVAERLFRFSANRAGRSRLGPGGLRAGAAPRCLVVSTGEDLPEGYSIRGRVLFIRVPEKAVNLSVLTALQEAGRERYLASAMGYFVRWLAPRYGQLISTLKIEIESRRRALRRFNAHPRTPDILANLEIGMELFTQFAVDRGLIAAREGEGLVARLRAVFPELVEMQRSIIVAADPVARFLPLLRAAMRSGAAHLATPAGGPPPNATRLGWEGPEGAPVRPGGPRIGWLEGDDLYLDFGAAYEVATTAAEGTGEPIRIKPVALKKRLNDQGMLRSVDKTRQTLTVRKMLGGQREEVVHLAADPLTATEET